MQIISFKKTYNNWKTDLEKSNPQVLKVIEFLGIPGEFINIEMNDNNTILKWLDQNSGIDLIGNTYGNIYGIASRIQFLSPLSNPYNTFTIRYQRHTGNETEFSKRMSSIEHGYFYPRFTIQAYISDDNIRSAAFVKTKDLYDILKNHKEDVRENISDNVFKIVNWDMFKKHGFDILVKV